MKFKNILGIFLLYAFVGFIPAMAVEVTFTTDEGMGNEALISKAEKNLAQVLTEINNAQKADKPVSLKGLAMDEFSKKSLARIWAVTPFYCDDEEVVDRLWVFANGTMMASHIPFIITPKDETFGSNNYQEAVVEFDAHGNITDFRFSLGAQTGESMENCGTVVELEKQMVMQQYLERFRTAYNTKDIQVIEELFSDDALIITGKVVTRKTPGDNNSMSRKVEYNRQSKQQYISNLRKAFERNKWIDVKFSQIGEHGESTDECQWFTRSKIDPTKYGVRLHQSWKSSNYSDEGYLFLLWEFPEDGRSPLIHVRTWQPEWIDKKKTQRTTVDVNISTLGGFGL